MKPLKGNKDLKVLHERQAISFLSRDPAIINTAGFLEDSMTRNELVYFRSELIRRLLDGKRKLDEECGYPATGEMIPTLFRAMYDREGIAARVVNIFPEACWELFPEVYEIEDTAKLTDFEAAWAQLLLEQNIWHYLSRVDELAGIGRFGVLLLGLDDGGDLSSPVMGFNKDGTMDEQAPERKLLYLRTFDESLVNILKYEMDERSPRFGQPLLYQLHFHDPRVPINGPVVPTIVREVHWSRVLHVADNCKTSEVFGMPRMQQLFNRLYDLRKLLGGCAEMFWKGAFPGFSYEVDPSLRGQNVTMDADKLKEEFNRYANGLQRYISTIGLQIKSLAPQVSDPASHIKVQIEAICLTIGCPTRIFMGSERGELASSQDTIQWHRRVRHRQLNFVSPKIIRPFVDRMIALKVLPPSEKYQVYHADLSTPDDETKAKAAFINTQALGQYVETGCVAIMGPKDYLIRIQKMSVEEAEAVLESLGGEKKVVSQLTEAFKNATAKPAPAASQSGTKTTSKASVRKGQRRPAGASK